MDKAIQEGYYGHGLLHYAKKKFKAEDGIKYIGAAQGDWQYPVFQKVRWTNGKITGKY